MNPETTRRRVMSISHSEFLHSLKPFGRYYPYRIDAQGQHIKLTDGDRQVEIRLGKERQNRLGALTLPVMDVDFHFHAFDPPEIERFFHRFDLCFRRGGG